MTDKQKRKKTGRPLLDISESEVCRLAEVGCSDREIAELHGCDQQTISRRFSSVLTKGRATLKRRLRRKQIELALKGDRTMLIWLGKQMLGQADAPTVAIQNNIEALAVRERETREAEEEFIQMCEGCLQPRTEKDAVFIERLNRVKAEMPPPTPEQSLNWNGDSA